MKPANLGIEGVGSSDRISRLPNDLLSKILSFIPINDAMATSELSNRWRSLWKTMPTLEYDEYSCSNIGTLRFVEFCGRSLQLHQSQILKTLTLKLKNHSDSLDSLLFPNIRSTLHEITIISTSYPCYFSKIHFPNDLNVFKTLIVLKLQGQILLDVADSPVCFQSLKTLHLVRANFSGEESFSKLLSACPVLEDLFFQRLSDGDCSLFTISVPSLTRLLIIEDDAYFFNDEPRFEINTPSLKYLKIENFVGSFTVVEDMPKLVDAEVAVHHSQTEKFLRCFISLEFLSVRLYASKVLVLADTISHKLLHLELHVYNKVPCNLLLHLLMHSPKLQVLKLHEKHLSHTKKVKDQPCSVSEPSSVPECLSFHLETFVWSGYEGTQEEKEVAEYILGNARCLKTATISIYAKGLRGGEIDLMMIKELESISKASNSCKLVIKLNNFS